MVQKYSLNDSAIDLLSVILLPVGVVSFFICVLGFLLEMTELIIFHCFFALDV